MTKSQILIKAAGGNRAIAAALGVDTVTIWRWGKADFIPEQHLKEICALAGDLIKPKQVRPDVKW